jgi:Gpi18-like mannosyltransferase
MANFYVQYWHRASEKFSQLKTHPLLHILLLGIALRLVLMPLTCHPYDVAVLYRATNDLFRCLNVYTTNSFSYPPLWAYINYPLLGLTGLLINPKILGLRLDTINLSVGSWNLPPVITSPAFNILSKLPLLAADVLIGIIIYDLVKDSTDEKRARLSFILWFLNPLVIVIDSFHGQFDVLPALMTVLAFCLFYKRSYLASGIAIGLGTLFKIYPVLLVPLYLSSIAKLENEELVSISEKIRRISINWLKLVTGILISFCVFLVPLIDSNIFHDVFNRTVVTSLGGLTLFNVAYIPGLEWLLPFISSHTGFVSTSLLVILAVVIILVSVASFFRRKDFPETFLLGHIAILLGIYLTSLTVNPQYVLWILPFLVLSFGLYHQNLKNLLVLSISAMIFLIGLSGPLFYLYPLAIFTPILNVETIYANSFFFEHAGGWPILLISGICGVIAIIVCFDTTLASFLRSSKDSSFYDRSQRTIGSSVSQKLAKAQRNLVNPSKVLTLIFLFLVFGQFLAYIQPLVQQNASFSIIDLRSQSNNQMSIQYMLKSSSSPTDMQILAFPVTFKPNEASDKAIVIYYDEAYPSSFVGKEGWIGLLDHVPIELKLRGYNGSISVVNAERLRDIMERDNDSIIIIPSGVFPETVHALNQSLVGDWLRAGGTLIWMGNAFGYLSGRQGGSIELFSENNFSRVQNQILGFTLFNDSSSADERYAALSASFSSALDLQYPDALVGTLVSNLLQHSGTALGKVTESENARTSISYLPVGSGRLVLFGGGIGKVFTATGEDVIAHDIAQILCSGILFSAGAPAYDLHELGKSEAKEASLNVPVPQNQNIAGIMIVVFSKSPYNRYFSRQFRPIGGS